MTTITLGINTVKPQIAGEASSIPWEKACIELQYCCRTTVFIPGKQRFYFCDIAQF